MVLMVVIINTIGNFHHQGIRCMIQYGTMKGLPNMIINNFPCSFHVSRNQSHKSSEITQILQLIHSNVGGPFRVRSLGGACFFLTFTDDYSKKA